MRILYFSLHCRLVDVLSLLAEHLGCYKLSLECKDENLKFYEALNFKRDTLNSQNYMVQRFNEWRTQEQEQAYLPNVRIRGARRFHLIIFKITQKDNGAMRIVVIV